MIRTPTTFPEVLAGQSGQGWTVEPHTTRDGVGGWTDARSKRMGVPLDASIQAQNVRVHELAHAKWTPSRATPAALCRRHGVSIEALQRAEDLRVGYCLIDAGVTSYAEGAYRDEEFTALRTAGAELIKHGGEATVAKRLAFAVTSVAMTKDRGRLIRLAEELGGESLASLITQVADAVESRLFGRSRFEHRESRRGRRSAVVPFAQAIAVARLLDQLFPPPEAKSMRSTAPLKTSQPTPRRGQWGTMTIEEPPRTVLARVSRLRRTRRATDAGAVIRRLDRLLTDGKVFAVTRRIPGGTLLIDGSGSMHWSREALLEVIAAAPAATVAIYSGRDDRGVLRLVIRQGRIVRPELIRRPAGAGNIIDGPALHWLATQAGPRIWISDGAVTGIEDLEAPALSAEALAIQLRARITRLDDLPAAIRFFGARRHAA